VAGYQLQTPKICTIRTSRKVFPGFRKYGLGHLTRELGIQIENRHRAGGDALATAQVLQLILGKDGMPVIKDMLKKEIGFKFFLPIFRTNKSKRYLQLQGFIILKMLKTKLSMLEKQNA